MKKLIAIILSLTIAFSMSITAFATEDGSSVPGTSQEEIVDTPETDENEENTEPEEPTVPEEKEPLTDEEIEEIRKEKALEAIRQVGGEAGEAAIGLLMLPLVPVMLIIPVFGWVTAAGALMSPITLLSIPFKFVLACAEAIDIYVNFDASEYQAIEA